MRGTYISGFLKKIPFGKMGHFCPKMACCHSSGATLRNILKFCIMKVACLILNSKGHALYILYLVTLSVSVWITPSLLVSISCLPGAFFLDQCSEYLLYLVFEYRHQSFIVYQTVKSIYYTD